MPNVEPLQKISVTLRAGAAPGDMNLPLPRPEFTFICGIGTGGMTPFEYLLAGRGPGDEICFRVTRPDMEQFFEHLVLAFSAPFKDRDEVHFQVRLHRHRTCGRPRDRPCHGRADCPRRIRRVRLRVRVRVTENR